MTVASRYANALFELASDAKQLPATTASVSALAEALADETIVKTLSNPRLTLKQRTELAKSMSKAVKAPAHMANTLSLLASNNRLSVVPAVLTAFQARNDETAGITHVHLSSAAPLTEGQRKTIVELMKKHTKASGIRLEETVDANLQGGFRAFFDGKVWDVSLSGQLARISTRLRAAISQRHSQ